jgi:RimJ/RimL family protein N-acetyltransferase
VTVQAGLDLLRQNGPPAFGAIPEGCVLRFYEESDDQLLVALLVEAFPRWPAVDVPTTAIEYLQWKLHSAANAWRYHVVAELGSRIVACRFFVLQNVKFGDTMLAVRQGVDTSVHPAFQGRGLMTALTYPIPDRLRGFDADFSVRSGEEAMERAVRYDERQNYYARVDVLRCNLDAAAPSRDSTPSAWSIRSAPMFDERIRPFMTEASAPFWLIVERTPAYLNWRFADARSGAFTIRIAEAEGRILGYLVLRALGSRGYIAVLLALPGRDDVVVSLVGDALHQFRHSGVSSVECWAAQNHPYRQVLGRHGFDEKRRTMQFYCQPIRVDDHVVEPFGSHDTVMHLVSGDTDLV